jgi:multiple sugar transport system substrate-binding protein
LARAAGYAKHRSRYSTLFDMETMTPLIASPPFVRALNEMTAAVGGDDLPRVDPTRARRAIHHNHSAMGVAWPTAAAAASIDGASKPIGLAELPGSREVYNVDTHAWQQRAGDDDGRVPVVGLAGRMGSVTKESRNAPAAFRLLAWLGGTEMSRQVSPASAATTLFRHSHVPAATAWVDAGTPAAIARQYAQQLEHTLSRQDWIPALGIPGSDDYVAVLDEAVQRALAGKSSAEETLENVATKWQEITRRFGVEAQKRAYARNLGL